MSKEYDEYLYSHKSNVATGYIWMRNMLKDTIPNIADYQHICCDMHDLSKSQPEEYTAYDEYFTGKNRSSKIVSDFNLAWLHHIHNNPHHWQYWILHDNDGSINCLEMPEVYVVEMICDWWSFSWQKGDLEEIFKWYDKNKAGILVHENTRNRIEQILSAMKANIW